MLLDSEREKKEVGETEESSFFHYFCFAVLYFLNPLVFTWEGNLSSKLWPNTAEAARSKDRERAPKSR